MKALIDLRKILMTEQHTNFIDRLVDSKPAVIKVADFIKKKGYQVTIPETKIAPTAAQHKSYADNGDLYVDGKIIDFKFRVEVKHSSQKFTNSNDWPWKNHFFVCAKHSFDNAIPKPHSYFIVSDDLKYFALVKADTYQAWKTQNKKDKQRDYEETFYNCPLDKILWEKF